MADTRIRSTPAVYVNNSNVPIMPNTVVYTEGLGEDSVKAASTGGGGIELLSSKNVEDNYSKVAFSIPATKENIELALVWKNNGSENVVALVSENDFTRTFTRATLITNYDVNLQSDGQIDLEFSANAAV